MTPELLDLLAQLGGLDPSVLWSFALAGIFGGSSKSSSKVYTFQEDRRIAATDSAVVAGEGSSVELESADPAVVQAALAQAFGFGSKALQHTSHAVNQSLASAERSTHRALQYNSRALTEALDFGGEAIELTQAALDRTGQSFEQGLEQQTQLIEATVAKGSEELQGLKGLLTTAAVIAVGAFVMIGLRK